MTMPEEKIIEIGDAALAGLLDRKGVKNVLQDIKYNDPDIWREICLEAGSSALDALNPF